MFSKLFWIIIGSSILLTTMWLSYAVGYYQGHLDGFKKGADIGMRFGIMIGQAGCVNSQEK